MFSVVIVIMNQVSHFYRGGLLFWPPPVAEKLYVIITSACYIMCYVKVWSLTKIDLSTWVADSFLVILLIFATRIVNWPVTMGVPIKVIIMR